MANYHFCHVVAVSYFISVLGPVLAQDCSSNHGVVFLFPTTGDTFNYGSVVNVSWTSSFTNPLLYTFCSNSTTSNIQGTLLANSGPVLNIDFMQSKSRMSLLSMRLYWYNYSGLMLINVSSIFDQILYPATAQIAQHLASFKRRVPPPPLMDSLYPLPRPLPLPLSQRPQVRPPAQVRVYLKLPPL
jgi:hypothetical protein